MMININKKNNYKISTILIFILIILDIILDSFFVVPQTKQAIITEFGKPIKVIKEAGLNIKKPLIQKVVLLDNRLIDLIVNDKEVIALDQKRIIVNAFAKFLIKNPIKFYNAFKGNTFESGFSQLNNILESSLRKVIGSYDFIKLLSNERGDIMQNIEDILNEKVAQYGIEIKDVRIMRSDLPKENSSAIFKRMQTERELEAKQIRAEGEERSRKIIANSNKEKAVILSEAKKKAEILKGAGEAEVISIFNKSFEKDSDFYYFYKSMNIYKDTLKNSKIILNSGNEIIRNLESKN